MVGPVDLRPDFRGSIPSSSASSRRKQASGPSSGADLAAWELPFQAEPIPGFPLTSTRTRSPSTRMPAVTRIMRGASVTGGADVPTVFGSGLVSHALDTPSSEGRGLRNRVTR